MKLLQIIAQKPEKTGSGVFVRSIMQEAEKRQYKQALVAGISAADLDAENLQNYAGAEFYPVFFETEKLPFPVVGMSNVMPYKSTRYCDMDSSMLELWETAFTESVMRAIAVFKPDAIISHHLWLLSSIVQSIASKENIPVVYICHGTDLRQMELCAGFGQQIRDRLSKAEMVLALTAHHITKIEEYYRICRDKITVIGAAYDPSIFYKDMETACSGQRGLKMIFAGKLSLSKGVLSLISAYDRLPCNENMELLVVGAGTGEECAAIEKAAALCRNRIRMLGAVSQNALADLFRLSDVFVLPSFYEGLPLVVLEALASGLRVVVTDLPGLRDWIGDEVVKTGMIDFVALPALEKVDIPVENELPCFEQRLVASMQKQIDMVRSGQIMQADAIDKMLHAHTWKAMFERLEEIITGLVTHDTESYDSHRANEIDDEKVDK